MRPTLGNTCKKYANEIRDEFCDYFSTSRGVLWQEKYVWEDRNPHQRWCCLPSYDWIP